MSNGDFETHEVGTFAKIEKLQTALNKISMIKLDEAGYITTLEQAVHIARKALE